MELCEITDLESQQYDCSRCCKGCNKTAVKKKNLFPSSDINELFFILYWCKQMAARYAPTCLHVFG